MKNVGTVLLEVGQGHEEACAGGREARGPASEEVRRGG